MLENGKGSTVRMTDIAKAAGISRQAVYLHFPTRAELLIALTRWMDEENNVDDRLADSRAAQGEERLRAYVAAWTGYIPMIYGVGKALMAMYDSDPEARAAWNDRMAAMRHGCTAAVQALATSGHLRDDLDETRATDLLWSLLSVRMWEHLRQDCGWSQETYVTEIQRLSHAALIAPS